MGDYTLSNIEKAKKKYLSKLKLMGVKPYYVGNFYIVLEKRDRLEVHRFFDDGRVCVQDMYNEIEETKHFVIARNHYGLDIFVKNVLVNFGVILNFEYISINSNKEDTKVIMMFSLNDNKVQLINYEGKSVEMIVPFIIKRHTINLSYCEENHRYRLMTTLEQKYDTLLALIDKDFNNIVVFGGTYIYDETNHK